MATTSIQLTINAVYQHAYTRFSDFVWDFFDDTKQSQNGIYIDQQKVKETLQKNIIKLLYFLEQFLEQAIVFIFRCLVKKKKVARCNSYAAVKSMINKEANRQVALLKCHLKWLFRKVFTACLKLHPLNFHLNTC